MKVCVILSKRIIQRYEYHSNSYKQLLQSQQGAPSCQLHYMSIELVVLVPDVAEVSSWDAHDMI